MVPLRFVSTAEFSLTCTATYLLPLRKCSRTIETGHRKGVRASICDACVCFPSGMFLWTALRALRDHASERSWLCPEYPKHYYYSRWFVVHIRSPTSLFLCS